MATVIDHPLASVTPPAAVTRVLSRFDREQLAAFISIAIDLLDVADGDPDLELNGDEADGSLAEDDFHTSSAQWLGHPGCPVSDPPEADGDEQDGTGAEDDCMTHVASGPGCPVSDPGGGAIDDEGEGAFLSDEHILAGHLRHIRQTRCYPLDYRQRLMTSASPRDVRAYRLMHWPMIPSRKSLLKRKRGMPKRPRP